MAKHTGILVSGSLPLCTGLLRHDFLFGWEGKKREQTTFGFFGELSGVSACILGGVDITATLGGGNNSIDKRHIVLALKIWKLP